MSFSSQQIVYYPLIESVREALNDYFASWSNEGKIELTEEHVSGVSPYDKSVPPSPTTVRFSITGWSYTMPMSWRGFNTEEPMVDTVRSDRVKYTMTVKFSEVDESDGTKTYTYTCAVVPDAEQAGVFSD